MKIIITCKDEDLDKSVDEVIRIADKIKGFDWIDCDCMEDGTTLILEKGS